MKNEGSNIKIGPYQRFSWDDVTRARRCHYDVIMASLWRQIDIKIDFLSFFVIFYHSTFIYSNLGEKYWNLLKWAILVILEQLPHRFLEEKHCSWCCSHLYPGEMPSMPMFRVLQWERRVFKNRSIVLPTTLFCVLTVFCWHGVNRKTKRLANLMKKCFHRKRMFGEAEALQ